MKKYKIETTTSPVWDNIQYRVSERFLFFWIELKVFDNKEDAIKYYKELTEKII